MYNVDYKRILSCNHFSVSTFTFHLKILFIKFSQQRMGYHPVTIESLVSIRKFGYVHFDVLPFIFVLHKFLEILSYLLL
jgi:hypothetical protein